MKRLIKKWRYDYNFKTIINSLGSLIINIGFAGYNLFLGLKYKLIWNGCISLYYLLLVIIKGFILVDEKKNLHREIKVANNYRYKTFNITLFFVLVLNISLIVPIILMLFNKRNVNMGLIPAIATATYTTYKIIMALVNIKKMKNSDNVLVKEIRTINLISALVATLTLQNTLIIVIDGNMNNMFILSAISSLCILLTIVIISIHLFVKETKFRKANMID